MENLLKGKLGRAEFWITVIAIWVIEIVLLLGGREGKNEPIATWRLVALLVVAIFYIVALILRIRDAGKGMGSFLLCLIIPIYGLVVGCLPSEVKHAFDVETDEKKNFDY